jgi:hypothetical protein
MITKEEIENMLNASYKTLEKNIGIKIRNGQAAEGIKKTLQWVLSDGVSFKTRKLQ